MTRSEKIDATKLVTKILVGRSVAQVTGRFMNAHIPAETRLQKVEMFIAGSALSGMAASRAVDWAMHEIDEMVALADSVKAAVYEIRQDF